MDETWPEYYYIDFSKLSAEDSYKAALSSVQTLIEDLSSFNNISPSYSFDWGARMIVDGMTVRDRLFEMYSSYSSEGSKDAYYRELLYRGSLKGDAVRIVLGGLASGSTVEFFRTNITGNLVRDYPVAIRASGGDFSSNSFVKKDIWEFGLGCGPKLDYVTREWRDENARCRLRFRDDYERKDKKPAMLEAFFGKTWDEFCEDLPKESPYRDPDCAIATCIGLMASFGHKIKDIMKLHKLMDESLKEDRELIAGKFKETALKNLNTDKDKYNFQGLIDLYRIGESALEGSQKPELEHRKFLTQTGREYRLPVIKEGCLKEFMLRQNTYAAYMIIGRGISMVEWENERSQLGLNMKGNDAKEYFPNKFAPKPKPQAPKKTGGRAM